MWDDNENVYLVDFPLTIIMYDPQYTIQAITAETSDGVDQIRIVRNYLVDQVIEPYTILPENYVGPTYTEDNVYLCPDKEAHSQWESTQETVDANGDVTSPSTTCFPSLFVHPKVPPDERNPHAQPTKNCPSACVRGPALGIHPCRRQHHSLVDSQH